MVALVEAATVARLKANPMRDPMVASATRRGLMVSAAKDAMSVQRAAQRGPNAQPMDGVVAGENARHAIWKQTPQSRPTATARRAMDSGLPELSAQKAGKVGANGAADVNAGLSSLCRQKLLASKPHPTTQTAVKR